MDNKFLRSAAEEFGTKNVTKKEIMDLCKKINMSFPDWIINDPTYKVARGVYNFSKIEAKTGAVHLNPSFENDSLVPNSDPLYVKFGEFDTIHKVIETKSFFPVYISGHSGNGKTHMPTQICAELERELFRVNITRETDEDDLLGGLRLVDGSTKWFDGPVTRAMLRGGILLLDEVNLASEKIMCLQPVLEGKGIFLKKINKFVSPAPGFNIIATANTKGQGDESGKYFGTNQLNEAFLERFPITIEQAYPDRASESQILNRILDFSGYKEESVFVDTLLDWADTNRNAFFTGGTTELLTTRRLIHIVNAYVIFGDYRDAIKRCIARFDAITQEAWLDAYEAHEKINISRKGTKRVDTATGIIKNGPNDVESLFGPKF